MGYVKASSYFQMNLGFHGEGNISEVYCPCFYLEHSNLSGVGDHQRDRPCPRVGTASGRGRRKKEWKDWAGSGKRGWKERESAWFVEHSQPSGSLCSLPWAQARPLSVGGC